MYVVDFEDKRWHKKHTGPILQIIAQNLYFRPEHIHVRLLEISIKKSTLILAENKTLFYLNFIYSKDEMKKSANFLKMIAFRVRINFRTF